MAGAVVIEPPDLPPVDRSFVLVSSEVYLGDSTARGSASEVDDDAVQAEEPDLVTFNGRAFQYDDAPLRVRRGERVRFWVLAAGPNRGVSFHVVGGQFDAAWSEGAWLLPPGPAQGGFVELDLTEAGDYPFVSHVMVDAERGAHGVLRVR
jgi:nitrite reductase (NO-forming)